MRASVPELGLPWQRVVGKRSPDTARVNIHDPVGAAAQRALLEDEGVCFAENGAISLRQYGWLPGERPPRGAKSAAKTSPRKKTRAQKPGNRVRASAKKG